jgi:hypothetical protein
LELGFFPAGSANNGLLTLDARSFDFGEYAFAQDWKID